MNRPLTAYCTRDRNNQPLVVLDSEPFNGMEINPTDLHRLAQQLIHLADLSASLPTNGKRYRPTLVRLGGSEITKETEKGVSHG